MMYAERVKVSEVGKGWFRFNKGGNSMGVPEEIAAKLGVGEFITIIYTKDINSRAFGIVIGNEFIPFSKSYLGVDYLGQPLG